MTETDSDDYPAGRFTERTVRKSTRLEIGLAIMLAGQLAGAMWWASAITAKLDTVSAAVAQYDPGRIAVLIYRVERNEITLAELRTAVTELQRRR